MVATEQEIHAGQAAFTKSTLRTYDVTLALVCRFAWRCPMPTVVDFYGRHLSGNHLEVGVGTGYFLDQGAFPTAQPRVGLLDLNPHCLAPASKRIARFKPEVYRRNVLSPIAITAAPFDSIGLNYVLHCLPGALLEKSVVFAHLKSLLNPGGVVFGATVLGDGVTHNVLGKTLMAGLNACRVFSNRNDTLDSLTLGLEKNFKQVQIDVQGSVALFSGRA